MSRLTLDALMGVKVLRLEEHQRALVTEAGRFLEIVGPGEHRYPDWRGKIDWQVFTLAQAEFVSPLEPWLLKTRPDLASDHFTEVRSGSEEVAVIERDGRIFGILKPDGRTVLWTDAGPWTITHVDVSEDATVREPLKRRLLRFGRSDKYARHQVPADQTGLLFVDGVWKEALPPGEHMFWTVGARIEVKLVDLRRRTVDVTGQEILTKDRVSLRVNLTAEYRVTDPARAATQVADFTEALYRALQLAFRRTLGALTLDELLARKGDVDAEAADKVRGEMAEIGVEVGEIALKDIILPGEMREILNRVVSAEKEAQANVIRRREETAAARSLLNTAKVMAENPIMLRLKELEALETISERVDSLVVHNGPKGLLADIAKLSE